MSETEERMVQQALTRYGSIYPPDYKTSFSDCFTWRNNRLIFWFNTEDHSTNLIAENEES